MSWKIEDLLFETTKRNWHQWSFTVDKTTRKEFYYTQSSHKLVEIDQVRDVEKSDITLKVYIDKENGLLGSCEGPLFFHLPLTAQLNSIENQAQLGSEQYWKYLKEDNKDLSRSANLAYVPLIENFREESKNISESLVNAIANEKGGIFNSAELFISKIESEVWHSNDVNSKSIKTLIYAEVCFSNKDNSSGVSEEFLINKYAVRPLDINFSEMCKNSALFSKASLNTKKPKSGKFNVVLNSETLNHLFSDLSGRLNATNKYFKMPFLQKDSVVVPEFEGDYFTLKLNPLKDFACSSEILNGEGAYQYQIDLIKDNKVQSNIVNSRMSQYLQIQKTSELGCLEVLPEQNLFKEIGELKNILEDDEVIEILQFSGLFTSPMTLTYSSEIRLAKVINLKTGDSYFIKGGNLSGNILNDFKKIKFGGGFVIDNQKDYGDKFISYYGPKWAMVKDVVISS